MPDFLERLSWRDASKMAALLATQEQQNPRRAHENAKRYSLLQASQ
jgi:hypothetical protein